MRIIFMGTPQFSVATLDSLVNAGHEVVAVITQPDKPKGRGKAVIMPPVKERALFYGIPVYQPAKVREERFVTLLSELAPDVIVVTAFGQILPKQILDLPRYGCVNVHASLLPKYRGAAPIQYAVIDGEKKTGITTMMMGEGRVDTGDMLYKAELFLDEKETGGSLHDKLSLLGGDLIVRTLKEIEEGRAVRIPQTEEGTCYAKLLKKEMGDIDWMMDAGAIERLIRGLNPWPSAYTKLNGRMIKIWEADVSEQDMCGVCGEIVEISKDYFAVKTGRGTLLIRSLQLEGRKRMAASDFLRGNELETGTILERSICL